MKLKFLAYGQNKDYEINGDTINGIDLSEFPVDGVFTGNEQTEEAGIINVERDSEGLKVTLYQGTIAGQYPNRKAHWREGSWIDASGYDPETCYVNPTGMQGLEEGVDYEIVKGVDVAGEEGWTVRKLEGKDE